MDLLIDIVGWLGASSLTACGIPQLIKTWKSKSVSSLSPWTLTAWFLGAVFMGIYVYFRAFHLPLFINYLFNSFVIGTILYLYLKYKHSDEIRTVFCGTYSYEGIEAHVFFDYEDLYFHMEATNLIDLISITDDCYNTLLMEFETTVSNYIKELKKNGVDLADRIVVPAPDPVL